MPVEPVAAPSPSERAGLHAVDWLLANQDKVSPLWAASTFARVYRLVPASRLDAVMRAAQRAETRLLAEPAAYDRLTPDGPLTPIMDAMYVLLAKRTRGDAPDHAALATVRARAAARPDAGWRAGMAGVQVVALHFQTQLGFVEPSAYANLRAGLRAQGYFSADRPDTLLGDLYGLTHVVLIASEYLRSRPEPADWPLEARRLDDGLSVLAAKQPLDPSWLDILAEVLLCRVLLKLPDTATSKAAVTAVLAAQAPDGAWGAPSDPLVNRWHHTQMAALALLPFPEHPRLGLSVF